MKPAFILLATTIWVINIVNSESACGVIGTNKQGRVNNRAHNFYLNTQYPALCNGTVSHFQFCYHRPVEVFQLGIYKSTFAIYRRSTYQTDSYDAFTPVFVASRTVFNLNLGYSNFTCASLFLEMPVTVQVGDVLGSCIFQPSHFDDQLDIISSGVGSEDYLMTTRNVGCGDSRVPSRVNSLEQTASLILHIYAEIVPFVGKNPSTENPFLSSTEEPSFSSTESPSFLPTEQPSFSSTEDPSFSSSEDPSFSSSVSLSMSPTVISSISFTMNLLMSPTVHPSMLPTEIASISEVFFEKTKSPSKTTDILTQEGNRWILAGSVTAALIILIMSAIVVVLVVLLVKKQKSKPKPTSGIQDGIENFTYEDIPYNGNTSRPVVCTALTALYESQETYDELLEKNKRENIYGSVSPYQVPSTQENDIYIQMKALSVLNVSSNEIQVVSHLGSGQFGNVERGLLQRDGHGTVDVALKILITNGPKDRLKFLQEAAIMAQFRHPNVIMLYGVVTQEDKIMLVVELAKKGDLKNFLMVLRPDPGELIASSTPNLLLRFSQQVALGMQYLSAKGFVHRDLAARNVLVSACNICKIADFGMSRNLAEENYYVSQGKDKIPVKWTAPEAIHYKKYSTASDVWAYGCLLYEIWSIGHKPFESTDNAKAIRLIDSGKRLPPPPGCPQMIYELMILCWNPETFPRPCFHDMLLTLVGNEEIVLNIPWKDSSTHCLAGMLGAPLETAEKMYTNLQEKYLIQQI